MMDFQTIDQAKATASIYFAVNLVQDSIYAMLKKKFGLKKKLDFKGCLEMVKKHVAKFLPDANSHAQLRNAMNSARETRNRYSHQDFDVNRFEHDVESLLSLASLLGLTECREQIMKHIGSFVPSGKNLEKLKAEASEHYKNSRWTEAMNCYSGAIRISSAEAALYSNRALCEIQLRKFELAREDAQSAIGIDRNQVKFYCILSEALYNLQLYKEAADACKQGLRIDSKNETLIGREKDCQAFIVDEDAKLQPVHDGSEKLQEAGVSETMLNRISTEDVCFMDSVMCETSLELRKAHRILQSDRTDLREMQKALNIFESAAKRGSAEGLYNTALMYKNGSAGLVKNPKKYLSLCREAAQQKPYIKVVANNTILPNVGVAEAENAIAMAYRDGLTVEKDDKLAFQWFLKSAQHGCALAMNSLGMAFYNGTGCEKHLAFARSWYQKSADLGQAEAQFSLAEMLVNEEGGPKDLSKAGELFKAAADQGFPGAKTALNRLQRLGHVGAKSVNAEVSQETTDSYENKVFFLVGMNYMIGGQGLTEADLTEAEKYLRKASNLNHKEATFELGKFLLQQRKSAEAISFLRKAAELHSQGAQRTFGFLLAFGHGCERDEAQARRWLLRSETSKCVIDDSIKYYGAVVEFEAAQNLSTRELTVFERIERYTNSLCSSAPDKQRLKDLLGILAQSLCTRHPAAELDSLPWLMAVPTMAERAMQGSRTANKFFHSLDLLNKTRSALESKNSSEAFRLYRQANRVFPTVPVDSLTMGMLVSEAKEALETNPNNTDAIYLLILYNASKSLCSVSELLQMALQCTNLSPDVADYQNMLGNMYIFNREFVSACQSIELALELEQEPDWLYGKASALRSQDDIDLKSVIDAYEEYIASSEPDSLNVPNAFYCIAEAYLGLNDEDKAKEFYEKGLHAESPEIRLPYFKRCYDYFVKKMLEAYFDAVATIRDFVLTSCMAVASSESSGSRCANCGKLEDLLRCSRCHKTFYCGRDCQRKHWKQHKLHCSP